MEEKHKELLRTIGVLEEEFELFDGRNLKYEYDPQKGVRLYDPFTETSTEPLCGYRWMDFLERRRGRFHGDSFPGWAP